mmetsp:Transcript_57712/g.182808  ORF Transcript_57712/g.182808 Transcript_57712/m.182808 type:complete len:336 (-) Transcript_57712:1323-2330(-)
MQEGGVPHQQRGALLRPAHGGGGGDRGPVRERGRGAEHRDQEGQGVHRTRVRDDLPVLQEVSEGGARRRRGLVRNPVTIDRYPIIIRGIKPSPLTLSPPLPYIPVGEVWQRPVLAPRPACLLYPCDRARPIGGRRQPVDAVQLQLQRVKHPLVCAALFLLPVELLRVNEDLHLHSADLILGDGPQPGRQVRDLVRRHPDGELPVREHALVRLVDEVLDDHRNAAACYHLHDPDPPSSPRWCQAERGLLDVPLVVVHSFCHHKARLIPVELPHLLPHTLAVAPVVQLNAAREEEEAAVVPIHPGHHRSQVHPASKLLVRCGAPPTVAFIVQHLEDI